MNFAILTKTQINQGLNTKIKEQNVITVMILDMQQRIVQN